MKFIATATAKGLEIDVPVYTLSEDGKYGMGKLIKQEKTAKGTVYTFEMATFSDNGHPPSINPTISTTISHVAIIKARADSKD